MRLILAFLVALMLTPALARAAPIVTPHVEAELFSSRAAIAPGETFTVLLRQKLIPNWHVYWINPGDSGEPTTLDWALPEGFTAGETAWPAPSVYRLGPVTNYVMSGEVLYPIRITAPEDLPIGAPITLRAKARWLVCEEVCIPESGDLALSIPVAAAGLDNAAWAAQARRSWSENGFRAENRATFSHADTGAGLTIEIKPSAASELAEALAAGVRNAVFYPYSDSLIDHAAPQTVSASPTGLSIQAAKSVAYAPSVPTDGVLKAEVRDGGAWRMRHFVIAAPPVAVPLVAGAAEPVPASPTTNVGVVAAVGLAFIGGLLLNIMPCVFPVLSIKALSLAGGAHGGVARRHGVLFLLGVLATFLTLAGALLALRAAGAAAGWGFQLQEPIVIATLALVFFLIGLNLLGAFEFGGGIQNLGGGLAARGGDAGAFFTGVLAVAAATPCIGPFLGGALGAALTLPLAGALSVFVALGLGFAAPFTLLSFAPRLQRLMPKPGPWMERLRQLFAFPMFATVVWLAWVLTQQTGPDGAAGLLAAFVGVGFLVWCLRQNGFAWRLAGAVGAITALIFAWSPVTTSAAVSAAEAQQDGRWSAARLQALRTEGKGVFVNFTADWCVTCKANEAMVLSKPSVQAALNGETTAYLKGDWTRRDAAIAAALAAHGRAGVPLYLYYAPGAATPVVLPQLLSEDLVLQTIGAQPAQRGD